MQILNASDLVQNLAVGLVERVPDQASIFKRNIVPDAFPSAVERAVQFDQILVAEVINRGVP